MNISEMIQKKTTNRNDYNIWHKINDLQLFCYTYNTLDINNIDSSFCLTFTATEKFHHFVNCFYSLEFASKFHV